jgi:hypothetical protein
MQVSWKYSLHDENWSHDWYCAHAAPEKEEALSQQIEGRRGTTILQLRDIHPNEGGGVTGSVIAMRRVFTILVTVTKNLPNPIENVYNMDHSNVKVRLYDRRFIIRE